MPPKKRRSKPNVVIGTVSTRSTRRQSLINNAANAAANKDNKEITKNTSDQISVLKILEDWDDKESSDSSDPKKSPPSDNVETEQPESCIKETKAVDEVVQKIKTIEVHENVETHLQSVHNDLVQQLVQEVTEECFVMDNNDDIIQEQVIGFESSEEEVTLECATQEKIEEKPVLVSQASQNETVSTESLLKELESDDPPMETDEPTKIEEKMDASPVETNVKESIAPSEELPPKIVPALSQNTVPDHKMEEVSNEFMKDEKSVSKIDFEELKAVLQKCGDSLSESRMEEPPKVEPKIEIKEVKEELEETVDRMDTISEPTVESESPVDEGDIIKAILEQKINELKLSDVEIRNKKSDKEPSKSTVDIKITEAQESLKEKLDLIEQLNREKAAKKQRELKQKMKAKERKAKQQKEAKKRERAKKSDPKMIDDFKIDDENLVRRSSRIKSINQSMKKRSTGHGVVRSKSETALNDSDSVDSGQKMVESVEKVQTPKSRSKSLENNALPPPPDNPEINEPQTEIDQEAEEQAKAAEVANRLKQFIHLKENLYLTDRLTCKEAKHMTCDCFLTEDDIHSGEYGCGEDCLNRLLMIECGNQCPITERCTNKRFQKSQFAPVEVFKTDKKGLGLRAAANIPYGEFILEYVGEVVDPDEFDKRAEMYSNGKNIHYYFMSLRADAIIDATMKGNISRFINHSCDPNAETQKWTVNGELRIGFFSTRTILAGEEITFDYRFQRYGKEAQKCYCESNICRGWLGEEPDDDSDEEYDEEEELDERVDKKDVNDLSKAKKEKSRDPRTGREDAKSEKTPRKRRSPKKKQRKEMFEDLDLDEEIEMLMTTGLKNQAHTLKLSRLIVRAKEPSQRTKLLRILRRGELACRRLFLDYHGLRLMHGYMFDVQHLVRVEKKFESLRLELLQTLAILPIQNKTMLQDSKVLSTVEEWSVNKEVASPQDSDSNSPKPEGETVTVKHPETVPEVKEEPSSTSEPKPAPPPEENQINYQEEIVALALKLLEEWSNLKEVFRIPKKERIEQMKEHEREANRKFMAMQDANEHERRNNDRYRGVRQKLERDLNPSMNRKNYPERSNPYARLSKDERRKIFALQVELKEEERRLKQREFWRQHEQNCLIMGTDPRLTAPFDPNRPYQCIWNPQIGQWQTISPSSLNAPPPMKGGGAPGAYPYNLPLPNWPTTTTIPAINYPEMKEEDPALVKFMGPIPPPVKVPAKWKSAKDKYGRPYYYHIKIRIPQWEPPPMVGHADEPEFSTETESSSDTSSLSSDSSSENSDSDEDIDDTQLLLQVRKQMEKSSKPVVKVSSPPPSAVVPVKVEEVEEQFSPEEKEPEMEVKEDEVEDEKETSIDVRLKRQFDLSNNEEEIGAKKKRNNLVEEIIISPRTEEDRLQFREDLKRYKQNKEKLKRQKELILQQKKKQLRELEGKKHKEKTVVVSKHTIKTRIKEMVDFNSEAARKIKENFRSNMATVVVSVLNSYRKPDCKEGRITNTEEFKHLARKLTHFVMLKEMKHISKIEELTCTDNVKTKAREYIKKYMSKFGEVYQKRNDEPDFRD